MPQPISVNADGNFAALWVPTIAVTTAPTIAELSAGSVVDLSCYITGDGFKVGTSEATVTDPRLCSRQIYEQPGRNTETLDVTYVYNIASPGNDAARITLVKNTVGHIVARWAIDFEQAFAAGDIVDVYPVKCGVQQKQPPTASGILTLMQKLFVIGEVIRDVTVAA